MRAKEPARSFVACSWQVRPQRRVQSNGIATSRAVGCHGDRGVRLGDRAPRLGSHTRLVSETDDHALCAVAHRKCNLERGRHAVVPCGVVHEAGFSEGGNRFPGTWAEIGRETDRGRPCDDDEGSDVGFEGGFHGPVGNRATADDRRQLVLTSSETPPSTPCEEDEAGRGTHPCILPEFRAIPMKPLPNQDFLRCPIITI